MRLFFWETLEQLLFCGVVSLSLPEEAMFAFGLCPCGQNLTSEHGAGKQQADWSREIEYLKGALALMAKTEADFALIYPYNAIVVSMLFSILLICPSYNPNITPMGTPIYTPKRA